VERKERSLYLIITKRLSISPSPLVYSLYPAFLDLRHSSEGAYAVNPEPSVHDIEKHASYIRYGIQWLGVSHTASIHRGVAEVACRLISTEPLRYGHHRHSHPRSKKKPLSRTPSIPSPLASRYSHGYGSRSIRRSRVAPERSTNITNTCHLSPCSH
jgi:hypothetical protein